MDRALGNATAVEPEAAKRRQGPLQRYLVRQFSKPRGLMGMLAGRIMERRPSNLRRNHWTVDLLELNPGMRVLEIGFGPGIALAAVCTQVKGAQVVGLDHSSAMLSMAEKRNKSAIACGQLSLRVGAVEDIGESDDPVLAGPFDRIFAVNVALFWKQPVKSLRDLHRNLADGGRIHLTIQPRLTVSGDSAANSAGQRTAEQMTRAGLANVRLKFLNEISPNAVCVIGERAAASSVARSSFR